MGARIAARFALGLALLFSTRLSRAEEVGITKLDEARAFADQLEYAPALALAEKLLAAGDNTAAQLVANYTFRGEVLAAMGSTDAAIQAFSCALELDPTLALSSYASPKIREPFDRAKETVGQLRLTATEQSRRVGGGVRTEIHVDGDPQNLVRGARFEAFDTGELRTLPMTRTGASFTPRVLIEWTSRTPLCEHRVTLIDVFGNELLTLGDRTTPLRCETLPVAIEVSQTVAEAPVETDGALLTHPAPYALLGALGVAVGTHFAFQLRGTQNRLQAVDADRAAHRYEEATDLDHQRRLELHTMWIGFAVAAVSGVVAAVAW